MKRFDNSTMKKRGLILFLLSVAVVCSNDVFAQCAMCTVVAEEAMRNGSSQGAGINKAVLFLFSMPYLIMATIGYVWWRRRVQSQDESVTETK